MADPHPYIGLGLWVLALGLGAGLSYLLWLLGKFIWSMLRTWLGF